MCKKLDCVKANGDPVTYEDDPDEIEWGPGHMPVFEHDSPRMASACKCDSEKCANYRRELLEWEASLADGLDEEPAPEKNDASSFHFFETLLDEAHPSSKKFYDHLIEAGLLHAKKQKDYGRTDDPFANVRASEEWGIPGWVGAMVRAQDKVRRLQTHASRGSLANESVKDSLLDLAVYALISLVLYEEETSGTSS